MANLSEADKKQLYEGSLIFYKKRLMKVKRIQGDVMEVFHLKTQRSDFFPFIPEEITGVTRRLGNVNVDGGVFYVTRLPVRQYSIGLTATSLNIACVIPNAHHDGYEEAKRRVKTLQIPEIRDCILNVYPSFADAKKQASKFGGVVAFDKQFSISSGGTIFYKTYAVGTIPRNCSTTSRIEFGEGYEHLAVLLDKRYEKGCQPICSSSR